MISLGEKRYACESGGSVKKGDPVVLPPNAVSLGRRAIIPIRNPDGSSGHLFVEKVAAVNFPDFLKKIGTEEAEGDARTLAIRRVGEARERDFAYAVKMMSEVRFDDWSVAGPRTTRWCLTFLSKRGGPRAHHEWWKSVAKLQNSEFGVMEHEAIMRAIEEGAEYDQMDLTNLGLVEHMMRRAQLLEYFHRERIRQELSSSTASGKTVVDLEEQEVFMGTGSAAGSVMICPELVSFVSKELERTAAINKQARKAREEHALRRK